MNSKVEIKKPPDIETIYDNINEQVYRTIKCPLKTVLKNYDIIHPIINNLVKDINDLIILGYQFIRLYLLDKFNNNKELPIINKLFILDVLKTISKTTSEKGKKTNEANIKNKEGKDDIRLFYSGDLRLVNQF